MTAVGEYWRDDALVCDLGGAELAEPVLPEELMDICLFLNAEVGPDAIAW